MSIGLSERTLRYRDMDRRGEEEVGLLPADSDADEHVAKVRRRRGIDGFRPRHRQMFAAMLFFLILGLAILSVLTAWVLIASFVENANVSY